MRQPAASSSAPHPLDRALFWLRWVFIGSVVVLALADDALLDGVIIDRMRLFGALAIAALGNLALGGLALSKRLSDRVLGGLDVLFDSALAGLFLWVYEGVGLPLLLLGTLAIFDAAFRFRWRGIAVTLTLLSMATLAATSRLTALPQTRATYLGFTLIFLAILGVLGAVLRSGGWSWRRRALDELESEAIRLRTTRERTRAIYELANTISASLDYRRVLEAAQDTGELLLSNDDGQRARVVSAALLFQGAEDKLRVVSSRHLTRSDEQVEIEGQRGILGLALKQAEPVFAGEALHDPELRYFAGFQDAKSLLVIPLRSGFEHYGVLVFGCDKPNAFSEEHAELLSAIGTQATLSLQNAVLYQTLLNEKEKIVEVEEDARKKLSRDLHDGPTQSVAAIAMRVNYIRRLIERQPQQAIEELWKVEDWRGARPKRSATCCSRCARWCWSRRGWPPRSNSLPKRCGTRTASKSRSRRSRTSRCTSTRTRRACCSTSSKRRSTTRASTPRRSRSRYGSASTTRTCWSRWKITVWGSTWTRSPQATTGAAAWG